MSSNAKSSTAAIMTACAIAFIIFVFCYLYFLQADILALSQFAWSDGQTHYNRMVGAVLLTIVFFLIHLAVTSLTDFPKRVRSLTFFPSLVLLGALTSGRLEPNGRVTVGWESLLTVVLLLAFVIVARQLNRYRPYESPLDSTSILSQASWMNMGIMVAMFCLCCAMGNTDRLLHNRLKMERYVSHRQYSKALLVAEKDWETDSVMTMMRAYSLSKKGKLGEELFAYPLRGKSRALLPAVSHANRLTFSPDSVLWQHLGAAPGFKITDVKDFFKLLQKRKKAKQSVDDYLLTAYLLDGDLHAFAREIGSYYDMRTDDERKAAHDILEKKRKALARRIGEEAAKDSVREVLLTPSGHARKQMSDLPKHYREALVLYTHIHAQRVLTYHDNVLDADYEDFLSVCRAQYASKSVRKAAIRDAYFGTYWYYYEMLEAN